jgi:hypothetical protein
MCVSAVGRGGERAREGVYLYIDVNIYIDANLESSREKMCLYIDVKMYTDVNMLYMM